MANESGVMDFAVDRRNVATDITGPSWPGRSRRRPAFRSRNTRIVPGHFSYARKAMQDVRNLKKEKFSAFHAYSGRSLDQSDRTTMQQRYITGMRPRELTAAGVIIL